MNNTHSAPSTMAAPEELLQTRVIRQMTEAVQQGNWTVVAILMKRGHLSHLPQDLRRRVVDETSKLCTDLNYLSLLVTYCEDGLLDVIINRMVTRGEWSVVGKALQREVSDSKCGCAIDEARKHASDDEFIDYILPHCPENQLDSMLTSQVERGLWKAVGIVLQRGVTLSKHKWAIDEACKHAPENEIIHYILSPFADNQLDSALTLLVERGLWKAVGTVLQRGVTLSKHKWAIVEACKRASDDRFTDYILPHCAYNELDSVLTTLVERGLWGSVGMVLERSVSYQQHGGWANDEACKRVSEQDITFDMLRRRTDSQLDSVLTKLVETGLWWSVGTVLQRGVSDSQHRWAIDEACEQASDEKITAYILPHCADDQLDTVLTPLVERRLWRSVGIVLQRGVTDSQHKWAIDEACTRASGKEIIDCILPYCADNKLDPLLTSLVERRLWNYVGKLLGRGVSESQHRWAIDEACKHAYDKDITGYILPHCAGDQLNSVLTTLVERGLWSYVGTVLKRGVSDSQHIWAIGEACKRASDKEITGHILPHCAGDQLNSVLASLVQRRRWKTVETVLKRGVSDSQHRWAIEEACKHACDKEITGYILPHCTGNQLNSVLASLVQRNLWKSVGTVLKRGVSDSQHRWAIDEACKHAYDEAIKRYILPHCADSKLDCLLTKLMERGRWNYVGKLLGRGVTVSQLRWVIDEACKHVSDGEITGYILPHCADYQLDSVLKPVVERGRWYVVGTVLERGVNDSLHRWATNEACKHASDKEITGYILPYCTGNQLDFVLTPLVERGRWCVLGTVLERGVSDSKHRWAIDEACKHASDKEITGYILPHCADSQLNPVLTPLVERGLWKAVGTVLKLGVSDSQHRWAINEACKHASHEEITGYILPHCADDQLDTVLTPLVERGLWRSVGIVLQRGVNDSQHKWAIDEACKQPSVLEITEYILPYCAGNQLNLALTPLVERGLWKAVGTVLKLGVSDSQHRWVIDEACKQASDKEIIDYILLHCDDNQLHSVLTPLVERGRWEAVATVLQRGVSDSQHRWAIGEACKHASDEKVINRILSPSADNQLDSVLPQLVDKGLWEAVGRVLERGACSDSQCRWAIGEVCNRGDNVDVEWCMWPFLERDRLPQFLYDGADYLLTQLIIRGLWKLSATLLCGVVRETLCQWAVVGDQAEPDDAGFWNMVRNPWYGVRDLSELCQSARRELPQSDCSRCCRKLSHDLYEVLTNSVMESVFEAWCTTQKRRKEYKSTTGTSELVLRLLSEINPSVLSPTPGSEDRASVFSKLLPCLGPLCDEVSETTKYSDRKHYISALHFIKSLMKHSYTRRTCTANTEGILVILATVPVVPDVQSVALRVLLRHKRWDIISHACLTHVWEQDRRQLFQAAVEQRQWNAVKRWADYSLYDDQRGWALEEAFQEKQWDAFLLLADYGLVESELMCVHYRLAKHADWDTVLQLFERGGDVTDVKELLTGDKSRKAAYDKDDALKRQQRAFELGGLERALNARKMALKTLKRAAKQADWSVVLFSLQRTPVVYHTHLALKPAVANGVWHVVRQLIKLGIDAAQRDSMFTRMVKQRQWGVCMVLLEQGVSVDLCLAALPELMDMDQWTLVARVMMYDVDDAVRRQVMQRAMERKQGTVVWQCVITMHGDRLSVEERKKLFQEAFNREVLQAIKPLIEIKDVIGIQHRDSVLPEAAEQHQWDVVDHCQLHHADIDMKDAEGHTPMHRASRKRDWEAVKALTKRGADLSLLDSDGESVLNRAIAAKQWDIVKLLIQFHGNIHQASKYPYLRVDQNYITPLEMLITACQGEIIEHTLMWCPDQRKGVNIEGETALHAVCLSGCPSALYYLVARGVDPQAVTKRRDSALTYAVLCKECPQKMVAECIKLGFCAYQPHITDTARRSKSFLRRRKLRWSPVLLSVILGLPVVTRMLYESGSCSYKELFKLAIFPWNLAHKLHQTLQYNMLEVFRASYNNTRQLDYLLKPDRKSVEASVRYLMKVCSTPRSLKSSCRLVISRCVTVRRQRHRDATYAQLPLTEELRNYVMFSDLTDPDYGQHETEEDEENKYNIDDSDQDSSDEENYFSSYYKLEYDSLESCDDDDDD